jgi:1-deoxy-D-xylulose-5-phosphate synthase
VNEYLAEAGIVIPVLNLGTPDQFLDQDKPNNMLAKSGLSETGILQAIEKRLEQEDMPRQMPR